MCVAHTHARALCRARARAHLFLGMIHRRMEWVALPQASRAPLVYRRRRYAGRASRWWRG
eukprot:COSAG01_NODE_50817_length_360_cov_0.639847_1_plen_59_part_01